MLQKHILLLALFVFCFCLFFVVAGVFFLCIDNHLKYHGGWVLYSFEGSILCLSLLFCCIPRKGNYGYQCTPPTDPLYDTSHLDESTNTLRPTTVDFIKERFGERAISKKKNGGNKKKDLRDEEAKTSLRVGGKGLEGRLGVTGKV